tara:strand:+ start:516 stop:971 length:456 start_codon:yes stop_codon:yes gene_type:complete
MANIFSYERKQDTERLISSDYAAISFGGGEQHLALVQSAQLNYGHQVIPRFEAGTSELYWVTGQAQGRVTIQRAVSQGGMFGNVDADKAAKGELIKFSMEVKDLDGGVTVTGTKNISFTGGVVVNLTASIQTGSLDVSEGVEVAFANMNKG